MVHQSLLMGWAQSCLCAQCVSCHPEEVLPDTCARTRQNSLRLIFWGSRGTTEVRGGPFNALRHAIWLGVYNVALPL